MDVISKKKPKHISKTKTALAMDAHIGLYKYVPVLILLLILVSFFYSFFVLPNQPGWLKMHSAEKEIALLNGAVCIENSTASCTIKNCSGTMTCKNGKWLSCRLNITCTPGSKAPCVENTCIVGYKICNECGTDYGECIKN